MPVQHNYRVSIPVRVERIDNDGHVIATHAGATINMSLHLRAINEDSLDSLLCRLERALEILVNDMVL
jgi:hypothetical protein